MKLKNFLHAVLVYILQISQTCQCTKNVLEGVHQSNEEKIEVPISKFCSLGKVLTWPNRECQTVDFGHNWTGFVYDKATFEKVDKFTPKYTTASENLLCDIDDLKLFCASPICRNLNSSALANYTSPEITPFILLTNGTLLWRSNRCTCGKCLKGIPLNVPFYVDGLGYPDPEHEGKIYYSGLERDQIVYYCNTFNNISNDNAASIAEYNLRNDTTFVVVLIITAFIYFLTATLYGIIWKHQNLPARILFSVVLSRAMMSLMLGLGYLGKLNRWDLHLQQWCFAIAISIHFFMLSSYSWTALLNFNLWWTFRSCRPSSEQNNLNKKYLQYSCIGWGLPLLITTVSVIIDSIYKNNPHRNYHLVPSYGNGVCFIVECAHGIYVHFFTGLFLIPALVFSVLTFAVLYKVRKDTSNVRDAKHGKNQSTFQLYVKLFVIMSSSWIIGLVIWHFNVEYDGSSGFYMRNTILLILHWGIDLLGSSTFILVVFGFSRTIRSKLEKNYTMFSVIFEGFRKLTRVSSYKAVYGEGQDSSTPMSSQNQMQTYSTIASN